jgi:hypothetical protein
LYRKHLYQGIVFLPYTEEVSICQNNQYWTMK